MNKQTGKVAIELVESTIQDLELVIQYEHAFRQYIHPNTIEEHIDFISNKNALHFVIKERDTGHHLGHIIITNIENENGVFELKRIVVYKRNIGIGKAALQLVKKHCVEKLHCKMLWLDVYSQNKAAIHVYESSGFMLASQNNNGKQHSGDDLKVYTLKPINL